MNEYEDILNDFCDYLKIDKRYSDLTVDSYRTEIKGYLDNHKELTDYVILDDEEVLDSKFIKCNENYGFGLDEFYKAKALLGDDKN